jgi:hypothetical protein
MNTEQMRIEFEKFAGEKLGLTGIELLYDYDNGVFHDDDVNNLWLTWQAALSSKSVPDELDAKLKNAGMLTVQEIIDGTPMDKFIAHAGVVDLNSYGKWLENTRQEFVQMQSAMQLEGDDESEMFEWVLAHQAALSAAYINFKKATAASQPPDDRVRELEAKIKLLEAQYKWVCEFYCEILDNNYIVLSKADQKALRENSPPLPSTKQ